jgi:hypothetical protein
MNIDAGEMQRNRKDKVMKMAWKSRGSSWMIIYLLKRRRIRSLAVSDILRGDSEEMVRLLGQRVVLQSGPENAGFRDEFDMLIMVCAGKGY